MHPFLLLLPLILSYNTRLSTAYPSPQLEYLTQGQCAYAGQLVCASESTFAICDASLTGIIQPLAVGDTRCGDFGGSNTAAAGASPSSSSSSSSSSSVPSPVPSLSPANIQEGTLGFMQKLESMLATASHQTPAPTTPPPPAASPKPAATSSSTSKKAPPKQTTTSKAQPAKSSSSSTPAPHFASGTSLAVVPTTIPSAIPTAGGQPPAVPENPPRDGCNPGKSTCSGGS